MEKRYFIFIALSFAFMLGYSALVHRFFPVPVRPKPQVAAAGTGETSGEATAIATGEATALSSGEATTEATVSATSEVSGEATTEKTGEAALEATADAAAPAAVPAPARPEFPATFHSLGSLDPKSGYTMLVHLTSSGAGVERIELTDDRYLELDDPSDAMREPPSYIGQLELKDAPDLSGAGAEVRLVGPGSPAADAGVKVGDHLVSIGGMKTPNRFWLKDALRKFKPDETVTLEITRDGKPMSLPVALRRCPLQLVKPEEAAPASLALTLQTLDEDRIDGSTDEIRGVRMRFTNWELLPGATIDQAEFRCPLPRLGLEVIKKYKLAPANKNLAAYPPVGVAAAGDPGVGYGLVMEVEVRNVGTQDRKVAYRLDGLNGLPTEGFWFAYKIGGYGQRDVAVRSAGQDAEIYPSTSINNATEGKQWLDRDGTIVFAGVDTPYFAGLLIPLKARPDDSWFQWVRAVRIGAKKDNAFLTNTTVQVASNVWDLKPGQSQAHRYLVFAGPKVPSTVLSPYDRLYSDGDVKLEWLMKYGWFPYLVLPLTWYLEFLGHIIGNYGIAIIVLTCTVRMCLFPLTRRMALQSARMSEKMARIKPDQDRIMEKFKNDPVAKQRALQELWSKNDVNPLGMLPGCLGLLLQFPVLIGLYNALRTDVGLRQASLFGEDVHWCSNLAAPDMLWYWENSVPTYVTAWPLNLGPYFNLLPVISTILIYFQQKRMLAQMPGMQTPEQRKKEDDLRAAGKLPALSLQEEQQRMIQDQQKTIMSTMTFVGAILCFRFPAGLALYFITSTLWGMIERETLPKNKPAGNGEPALAVAGAKSSGGGFLSAFTGPAADEKGDGLAEAERKKSRKKQDRK